MAIYHFSAKVISRGAGRSSTAAAAYRAGRDIADERTGERHDYTRKRGVLDHAVLAPSRAPDWARASASLWNAVERFEKRRDAQLCREVIVALPHELTLEQNREMLHAYVQEAFIKRGMAAQVDIHGPHRDGDKRNIHAHVLLTTRQITRSGFKAKKARNWNEKATLLEWRDQWARHVNRALERARQTGRVDARSFKDRGIADRAPSSHLGPAASQMERRGENSRIGDENRAAAAFNELQRKAKVIDLQIERERREQAAAARRAEAARRQKEAARAKQAKRANGWNALAGEQERRAANDRPGNRPTGEWANRQRAALQDRQLDERGELGRRQAMQRDALAASLRRQYSGSLRENRRALADIARRQKQGGIRGMLYRMSGRAEADRREAENRRKSAQNARWRIDEQRDALGNDQRRQARELEQRHRLEAERLEQRLADQRAPPRQEADALPLSERVRRARQAHEARERDEGPDRDRGFER